MANLAVVETDGGNRNYFQWYCKDNTDTNFASCDAPMEQEEMEQDSEPYVKTFKRK